MAHKRVITDLDLIFNRKYSFKSPHLLVVGDVSVNEMLGERAIDFDDDYKQMVRKLILFSHTPNIYRRIDLNAELATKMVKAIKVLEMFCISTSVNKLGRRNHCYKASPESSSDTKLKQKFYKKCSLSPFLPDLEVKEFVHMVSI